MEPPTVLVACVTRYDDICKQIHNIINNITQMDVNHYFNSLLILPVTPFCLAPGLANTLMIISPDFSCSCTGKDAVVSSLSSTVCCAYRRATRDFTHSHSMGHEQIIHRNYNLVILVDVGEDAIRVYLLPVPIFKTGETGGSWMIGLSSTDVSAHCAQ